MHAGRLLLCWQPEIDLFNPGLDSRIDVARDTVLLPNGLEECKRRNETWGRQGIVEDGRRLRRSLGSRRGSR